MPHAYRAARSVCLMHDADAQRTDKDWLARPRGSAVLVYTTVYYFSSSGYPLCHPRRKEYSYVSHEKAATDGPVGRRHMLLLAATTDAY